jgi:periplasmic protein TonB
MSVQMMPAELDSPKERRVLFLCVLLGHALLFGVLALQRANSVPKPLEIELSLSAAEAQPQIMKQPLAAKSIPVPLKPTSVPAFVPTPALPAAPAVVPTQSSEAHSTSQPSTQSAPSVIAPKATAPLTGGAVLPNADAAYLTNPKPGYPPLSRRLGEQGVVILSVLVGEGGDVQKLEVAKSSGYTRLDEAASRAVQGWRFAPGKRAGIAQAMWVKVPISFILEK